ncbi:hypothetical protein PJWF_00042 [Achromobacter phage JWF]|uniref:hypothetical protein n=1 Tax=Achromobacter phage JWF TaxID=1589748 RepID=UPI000588E23A|nr:hypothetical protein AXJ13_gp042 [Achromobacter phage JWF]AJD82936.1 hypothetical protein PJWF_00042 [Achromobacter phage JWF]
MTNIKQLLEKGYGPQTIVQQLGVTITEVVTVIKETAMRGWGAPDNIHRIVSRKKAWERSWPEVDQPILAKVRVSHDEGKISMVQARDGDYIIQYAVPVISQPRTKWFTAEKEAY